jgi:histidinol-phosphate aminotransferase
LLPSGEQCQNLFLNIELIATGLRLGIALAQPPLIQILSNTKAPYNISTPTAALALSALSAESVSLMREKAQTLVAERAKLLSTLAQPKTTSLGVGPSIGGNDANFVLVPILARPASLGADRDSDGAAVVNGSAGPAEGQPDNVRSQAVYTALAETEGVVVRFRGHEPGCDACLRITVGTPEENELAVKKLAEVLTRI